MVAPDKKTLKKSVKSMFLWCKHGAKSKQSNTDRLKGR